MLDLGGGSGGCFVSAYPHKSHVIPVDKNPHTVIETKMQFPQIMAVVTDGCSLLFRDKSISVIFSNSVIEHVALQGDFAKGIQRVGEKLLRSDTETIFSYGRHYLISLFPFLPKFFAAFNL